MKDRTVYVDYCELPLAKALLAMTDEWCDCGKYCTQTVLDLRDACMSLIAETERAHDPRRDWMLRADKLDAENTRLREENLLLREALNDMLEACVSPAIETARMREIRDLADGKHRQDKGGTGYGDV